MQDFKKGGSKKYIELAHAHSLHYANKLVFGWFWNRRPEPVHPNK